MDEVGIYVRGMLASYQSRLRDKETVYDYLVVAGMDAIKITSETNHFDRLSVGDLTTWKVKTNVYNNKIYYSGALVE